MRDWLGQPARNILHQSHLRCLLTLIEQPAGELPVQASQASGNGYN